MMAKVTLPKLEGKKENCEQDGVSWPYGNILCVILDSVSALFEGDVTPAMQIILRTEIYRKGTTELFLLPCFVSYINVVVKKMWSPKAAELLSKQSVLLC